MLERILVAGRYSKALPGECVNVAPLICQITPGKLKFKWITPEQRHWECAEMLLERITSEIPF